MFMAELIVPFLIFGPRRARIVAFWVLAGFQTSLILTGNFAHFSALTLALCVLLLDDDALKAIVPPHLKPLTPPAGAEKRWRDGLVMGVAVALIAMACLQTTVTLAGPKSLPGVARRGLAALSQWHLVGRYGVFAVMTTQRLEIVIEGSSDGHGWRAYRFKHKAGRTRRPPSFVAPHQPRLDWQMWFASLRGHRHTPWFSSLIQRLLEGSPEVLDLFAENPFPEGAPVFVRARLYEYRFSDLEERGRTGQWWLRQPRGMYFPAVSLPPEHP
jgi:hypothetical protein